MERKEASVIALTLLLITPIIMSHIMAPVTAEALLQITTDKNIYAPGEEVKVTIKNIGDASVEIGGYPCVMIYTYHDLEPVWPTIFAFLLWSLAPGESRTWTWNQYNEYTQSPAELGMYIVKFYGNRPPSVGVNQALFEISDGAARWIPDVPLPELVDLAFWTKNRIAYVTVTITHGDAAYNISDWGTIAKEDSEIWADSRIWDWTGPAPLVITKHTHIYDLGRLEEGSYTFTFKAWGQPVKNVSFTIPPPLAATVSINPYRLNLKSAGEWITAYIELPNGYDVNNIDVSTIRLNDTFLVDPAAPTQIGDYDTDGITDLMVKFNRAQLESYIYHVLGIKYGSVTLEIVGQLYDGACFEGSDTIFVNYAGDANNDGTINVLDASMISAHWYPGPATGPLGYDANADFNKDGAVNIIDAAIVSDNWEQIVP